MNMKVNILGVEYKLDIVSKSSDPKLECCDGYCDRTAKRIVVEDFVRDSKSVEDLGLYKRQVLRHEIIHAFLYESGLHGSSWAINEEIVDYIAIQFPKLVKAFTDLEVMD